MVAHPSPSGAEAAVGELVESAARAWGLDARRDERGVVVEVKATAPGPTLALVSHLDTVPPGEGWTRDPFGADIEGGRLWGRGSGDAKGPAAAMLTAARDVTSRGGPHRGRLLVLLGYGEETRETTMPRLVADAGPIDAAIVGEPTALDLAVAQRGLVMVDLVARGEQRHAGNAADGAYRNAIVALARDLTKIDGILTGRPHPILGETAVTPTIVEAGVGRNVTPPRARAILDVRSTPSWTHAEIASRLHEALEGEVRVVSDRLVPCETPEGSRLLEVAHRLRPAARRFGSPTCSDWVFFVGRDVIKCGPGDSGLSHAPDESIALDQVTAARAFYAAVVEEYLT